MTRQSERLILRQNPSKIKTYVNDDLSTLPILIIENEANFRKEVKFSQSSLFFRVFAKHENIFDDLKYRALF